MTRSRPDADSYASDARGFLDSGAKDMSLDPRAELAQGVGYALLALDARLAELMKLLDERL